MQLTLCHLCHDDIAVLLSSRPGLGLEDPRRHLMKVLALDDKVLALALAPQVLALALAPQVLALAPQVLALALALRDKSWFRPCKGQGEDYFPQDSGHVVAVPVCSAHTHGVT